MGKGASYALEHALYSVCTDTQDVPLSARSEVSWGCRGGGSGNPLGFCVCPPSSVSRRRLLLRWRDAGRICSSVQELVHRRPSSAYGAAALKGRCSSS